MKLSDLNPTNNLFQITAGEAITKNDAVQLMSLNSKGEKVRNTDLASIGTVTYGTPQTNAATGQIVAQTSITAGILPAAKQRQNPLYINGNVFIGGNGSSANNFTLYKYNTAGALVKSLSMSAPGTAVGRKIFQLSDGNICCVYDNNDTTIYFQIVDENLNVIKAETAIASTTARATSSSMWDAIPLSAGGFAVIFASTTSNLDKFGTYDNAGTVVTAVMTVNTRTGTDGVQRYMMKQLSNGDIAIAQDSANTVSSIGGYYSVITTAGVVVKAFTQVTGATTTSNQLPAIEVLTGYFCVNCDGNNLHFLAVYNNAGTLQGSVYSPAGTMNASPFDHKIVTDGTSFYWIGKNTVTTKTNLVKITTAGVTTITDVTPTTTNYGFDLDAFYDSVSGMIVGVSSNGSGNAAPTLWIIDPSSLALVSTANTTFGAVPGTSSDGKIAVTNLNDGAFVAYYSYTTTANNCFTIGKWANTSILGVAVADASVNTLIPMMQGAGSYPTNAVKGSPSKAFDMSATASCYGNKGTICNNALVLRGM